MKTQRSISFYVDLLAEYDKRTINLNELINKLLAEHLAFIQLKEEREKSSKVTPSDTS